MRADWCSCNRTQSLCINSAESAKMARPTRKTVSRTHGIQGHIQSRLGLLNARQTAPRTRASRRPEWQKLTGSGCLSEFARFLPRLPPRPRKERTTGI